jgi:predicted Rossmann fold nucleotide-binding protein DprA/Smf involved in DNA uptake
VITKDSEIEQEILDNWEYLEEARYPEDYLDELADSHTPIYYSEIIEEWRDMPSSFSDTWQEFGVNSKTTITDLMTIDLNNYYRTKFNEIYEEIKTAKDSESDD